jgi:hypothetical protein
MVQALLHGEQPSAEHVVATVMSHAELAPRRPQPAARCHRQHFAGASVAEIMASLAAADDPWAQQTHEPPCASDRR